MKPDANTNLSRTQSVKRGYELKDTPRAVDMTRQESSKAGSSSRQEAEVRRRTSEVYLILCFILHVLKIELCREVRMLVGPKRTTEKKDRTTIDTSIATTINALSLNVTHQTATPIETEMVHIKVGTETTVVPLIHDINLTHEIITKIIMTVIQGDTMTGTEKGTEGLATATVTEGGMIGIGTVRSGEESLQEQIHHCV